MSLDNLFLIISKEVAIYDLFIVVVGYSTVKFFSCSHLENVYISSLCLNKWTFLKKYFTISLIFWALYLVTCVNK